MSRTLKPRVNARPGADHYSAPNEKIIEYSCPDGTTNTPGGLIAFRWITPDDGSPARLVVNLYRHGPAAKVQVVVSPGDE